MSFESLVNENLGLVHSCCNRFRSRASDYEELYSVGCLGLVKAAKKFDSEKGYKFSTYAVPVILGEIKMYFREANPIKFSRETKSVALKVKKFVEEFEKNSGTKPSVKEIATALEIEPSQVTLAMESMRQVVSLESEVVKNTVCSNPTEKADAKLLVLCALERMEKCEKDLIKLRFFGDKTQKQTAKILNMTQVQVSRAEKRALQRLKELIS